MIVVFVLLSLVAVARPATIRPDAGGSSACPTCPETSADERPLLLQKEAIQRTVFDNCFLATTPVVAGVEQSDGAITRVVKPIEDVQEDEWVQAKDPHTGEVGWKRVKELHRNWTNEVWYVRVGPAECLPQAQQTGRTERHDVGQAGSGGGEGGEDGEPPPGSHVVRCTAGHPWGVRDADGVLRFRYTAALHVGARLDAEPGAPAQVVLGIEVRQEVARTYNFEVEGFHTYYVAGPQGQPGVLVHNVSKRVMERVARVLARGGTLTPRHFGKQTLSENPALLRIWNRAMRKSLRSSEDNAFKTYSALRAAGKTVPDDVLKNAWSSVQGNFLDLARKAGHNLATVHHWNFPRHAFSGNVFDPRHLVPITMRENARGLHYFIHKSVTGARGPAAWFGGVGRHAIDLGGP